MGLRVGLARCGISHPHPVFDTKTVQSVAITTDLPGPLETVWKVDIKLLMFVIYEQNCITQPLVSSHL